MIRCQPTNAQHINTDKEKLFKKMIIFNNCFENPDFLSHLKTGL